MTDPQEPTSFLAELKRRRVYRTAVLYLATAFVVLQVADLTFERIGLPGSAVKIVIIIAAIGFPVSLPLAWIFEITPGGIRRDPDEERSLQLRRALGTVAATAIILVAAAAAIVIIRRPARPSGELDPNTIAVLPFSVSGRDVEYLGEGLVELLASASTDPMPSWPTWHRSRPVLCPR